MIATAPAASPETAAPERQRYRTLLLFGAPGSGKGTIGKALGAIPGFVHFACGDAFRMLYLSSSIGKVFVDYSSRGLLVPDDTTIELWRQSIDSLVAARNFVPERDTLVLDGIPRNIEQVRMMEPYIDVQRIFHLVCVDESLMFERLRRRALKENRLDDANDEVIRRRWGVYEEESRQVLAYYSAEIIQRVDAAGSPIRVLHTILGYLLADQP